MSRALVPLTRDEARRLRLFTRFRLEFIRQHVRAAADGSAVIIANSAADVLDPRRATHKRVLTALEQRKEAASDRVVRVLRASEYAKRRAVFMRAWLVR